MSNSNPNFVSELVQMAKAFEELPIVKAELERATHEAVAYLDMVTQREESILRLKVELEASHEARRRVEAERDDAEFRFLDSEVRTAQALNFIRSTFGSAGSLIQALEPPPKVEPVSEAISEVVHSLDPIVTDAPVDITRSSVPHTDMPASTPEPHPFGDGRGGLSQPIASEVPKSDANPPTSGGAMPSTDTSLNEANVSYANEPDSGSDWQGWNRWCSLMTQRYGNVWPDRPTTHYGTPI